MRSNRLVATLLLMQARGRVTASEVATELEVSVATARRDLEALSAAGVPVYPQPGRGGGWSLVGGARTDLTGLTSHEALALFALVGPAASADPRARAAHERVCGALPATFRSDAEAAAEAIIIDAARWGKRDRQRPAIVDDLRDAVVRRLKVSINYENRMHQRTQRVVDPWGLIDKDGVWYLIGDTDNGRRTFRVDRIIDATTTNITGARPAGFELSDEWKQVVDEMEERRSLLSATVLIAERFLPVLQDHFGRHCEVLGRSDDGRLKVRVAAPMAISIAEYLAGWGTMIEVLEPASVCNELARIGTELVQRYASA
jgi:predicted DNA-binding transcriptional regulator YafY